MNDKTGLKSIAEGRSDMHRVDPRKLQVEAGWNQRENTSELATHIDMLAQSIAQVGVREPLRVVWRDGQAFVRSGHCRLAASLRAIEVYKAELKTVPVIGEDRHSTPADQFLGQIIDNSGKPLSAFETAKVYKKLIDLGWAGKDIAAKCGVSQAHVSQVLDYLSLPDNLKAMVISGQVSGTLVIKMLKDANGDAGKVIEQLKEAVGVAASQGRKRAMPKDMQGGEKRPGLRKLLKDAFEGSDVIAPDGDEGIVLIRMTTEDFEHVSSALGLDITIGKE